MVVMCYCYAAGSGAFRVVVPCLLEYFSHPLMMNILSGPQHPICERGMAGIRPRYQFPSVIYGCSARLKT